VSDGTAPVRPTSAGRPQPAVDGPMVPGSMFADAVAIVSSIDPIMGEVDR
jgi:NADH:ubiquinone oxidoreductase subunit D